jgi:hypothetical protein
MSKRITFWVIVVITTILALLGWQVWQVPGIAGIGSQVIEEWYLDRLFFSATVGTGFGFVWAAFFTRNRVLHQPNETAGDFTQRVLRQGLRGMALSGLVVFVIALGAAVTEEFVDGLAVLERINVLVFNRKCLGLLCVVAPTMGLTWGVSIRLIHGDWGGARALIEAGGG